MIEDKEAYIAKRNELLNNREEVLEAIEIAEGYKGLLEKILRKQSLRPNAQA